MKNATHFLAEAGVRYWEDATVNNIEDVDGTLIPGRDGDTWRIKIDLASGKVEDWPEGTSAAVHYKVCDAGQYWLLDAAGNKIAYREGYVPGDFLCHRDNGYGDYIIMDIGPNGQIADYRRPDISDDGWSPLPAGNSRSGD